MTRSSARSSAGVSVSPKAATSTIPIVVFQAGEPEETGLVASLAHPGGNLTGLSDMSAELSAKRLQLLKEAVPSLKRAAMLYNADDAGMVTRYKAASAVAPKLGVTLESLGVREPDDFGNAFDKMAADPPDGILMVTDVLTILNRKRVIDFAAAHKIPAIYELALFAKDGGLMSYGPNQNEMLNGVADLVARILKGAKPGDLPFEQPTLFEFAINRKTADACGCLMFETLDEWNREREAAGEPRLAIGIGLNFGPAVLGDVGSEQTLSFTVIGDTVNTASRLQGFTRILKTPLVVGDALINALRLTTPDEVAVLLGGLKELGLYQLRGRSAPGRIWTWDGVSPFQSPAGGSA